MQVLSNPESQATTLGESRPSVSGAEWAIHVRSRSGKASGGARRGAVCGGWAVMMSGRAGRVNNKAQIN